MKRESAANQQLLHRSHIICHVVSAVNVLVKPVANWFLMHFAVTVLEFRLTF